MSSDSELDESQPIDDDRVPGYEEGGDVPVGRSVRGYLIGLLLAAALTASSFWAAQTHLIYAPAVPLAIAVLALAQMGVHLVYFLHLTTAPDNTNNAMALAFGALIAGLVVFGSVWIMAHLNERMLPMQQLMQMQQSGI